jgi:hypothetical protein
VEVRSISKEVLLPVDILETIYTHVISEDGKRIAAQLGNAVWGVLDASWTEKENGQGVESPKPFVIN